LRYNTWPDGRGEILFEQIADPAAGSNFHFVVPANRVYRLRCLACQLVTDATVLNRYVVLTFYPDGVSIGARAFSAAAQPASQTMKYTAALGLFDVGSVTLCSLFPVPNLYLPAGAVLNSSVGGLQGADQVRDIYATWEVWRTT